MHSLTSEGGVFFYLRKTEVAACHHVQRCTAVIKTRLEVSVRPSRVGVWDEQVTKHPGNQHRQLRSGDIRR